MIKLLTFDNLLVPATTTFSGAKTRSRMTTAITFSRQLDAVSRVNNTRQWENVVLVLEAKARRG